MIASANHLRTLATASLLYSLLCAGCVGPFRGTKSCESCGKLVNGDEATWDATPHDTCGSDMCRHEGTFHRVGRTTVDVICLPYDATCCVTGYAVSKTACIACWPYRACCQAVNFCV